MIDGQTHQLRVQAPVILEPTVDTPEPVFVVGMNGSGTSMLTESLGRHPDLYAFPGETRMIPHYIHHARRFGDLSVDSNFLKLWQYVITSAPDFEVFNGHRPLSVPDNWRDYQRDLATIIDAVFRQFALQHGKSRWCEKSPNNSEHLLALADLYPRAKFVHIIRDGRDCAASVNRRQYRNPKLAVYRWRLVVDEARRQGKQLGNDRYMEFRYEDLTTDPSKWMRVVCEFLDLPFTKQVLESSMPQSAKSQHMKGGAPGKIEPNSKKFLSYFSEQQLRRLEHISGATLKDLGYDVIYDAGHSKVGFIESRIIRGVDFVRANHRLRKKLAGQPDMTWGKVFRGTLASIREYNSKKI